MEKKKKLRTCVVGKFGWASVLWIVGFLFSACGGAQATPSLTAQGIQGDVDTVESLEEVTELAPEKCGSEGKVLCLGLKTVVFKDQGGTPTVNAKEMQTLIQEVNSIWAACGVEFTLDQYLAVDPTEFGIQYQIANYSDLTRVRETFADSDTLLVVTTGPWNRAGSLGNTGANAWTSMPGEDALGVVLEKSVGTYTPLVAHELGHYLSLDHQSATSSLMSPVIYNSSRELSTAECRAATDTILDYWNRMLR